MIEQNKMIFFYVNIVITMSNVQILYKIIQIFKDSANNLLKFFLNELVLEVILFVLMDCIKEIIFEIKLIINAFKILKEAYIELVQMENTFDLITAHMQVEVNKIENMLKLAILQI